jgi:hypothetical protein
MYFQKELYKLLTKLKKFFLLIKRDLDILLIIFLEKKWVKVQLIKGEEALKLEELLKGLIEENQLHKWKWLNKWIENWV